MSQVSIDGVNIWYDVHGDGEEHLLQIGGAGFAHENFGFVTHLMTPHFKVIEMDLRGYGASDKPPRGYDTVTSTTDVASVLRSLGASRATIVGHGWGGLIAWSTAVLEPEVIRAIARADDRRAALAEQFKVIGKIHHKRLE